MNYWSLLAFILVGHVCYSAANKGAPGQIRVFEDENFDGGRETITIPSTGCHNLVDHWDDVISSVDPMNSCIVAYEAKHCSGRSVSLDRNTPNRNRLSSLGMNDAISSIKLCA